MSWVIAVVNPEADQPDQLLLPPEVLVRSHPLKEMMRKEGIPPERIVHGQSKDGTARIGHQEVIPTNLVGGIYDLWRCQMIVQLQSSGIAYLLI